MNHKIYQYTAKIEQVPGKDGAFVEFPYDLRREFGKGRLKVHATFDGVAYEGSIVNMGLKYEDGSVRYIIGVLKSIRQTLCKQPGDEIEVTIRERIE